MRAWTVTYWAHRPKKENRTCCVLYTDKSNESTLSFSSIEAKQSMASKTCGCVSKWNGKKIWKETHENSTEWIELKYEIW